METKRITTKLTALILSTLIITSACKQEELHSSKENEERELILLRAEIQKMSEQQSCDQAGDWKIVPIGARPCGGANGFVAYSINGNTNLFLQKVADYSDKEKAFNLKWNLVSDCSVIIAPKSVSCENGKPKLVY